MWQTDNNKLHKAFTFKDFAEAIAFVNDVASLADYHNHHPLIQVNWNRVDLWLSTHDAGDVVTDKDEQLAEKIDALLASEKPAPALAAPKKVKLYGDGGSRGNPGPSASGYVILDMDDNIILKTGVYMGITTNNQAEYHSLKFGLEAAQRMGVEEVDVFMDSMLVVNQMKGIFKVKNAELKPIHELIKELAAQFKQITYTHVPRELNKLADEQVNAVLDAEAGKS